MENNSPIHDPKYVSSVYNALKTKVEGFNKTPEEFNEALKDESYVNNVHNALKKAMGDNYLNSYDEAFIEIIRIYNKYADE